MSGTSLSGPGLLADRYVLEGLIGRGGMADVYRAHDRMLDRSVAVKLLRGGAASETERARFTDEARTVARLRHPGLVTILDASTTDDEPYLVMELVRGPNLAQCCGGTGLEPSRVAAIGAQLADALGHAHAAGVVHRDLKPGNVLLSADGRALLTDFGVARLMSGTARHTTEGVAIGTAAYMAPEQVRGQDVSPAADVYSLGLVLLEALTGERAYRGLPVEAALARLTTPPAIPDTVPVPWRGLLRAMTGLDPADRPSTAAVAASLRGLASGIDPAAATAALRVERQLRPGRGAGHARWLVRAAVGAALVVLVGASFTSGDQGGPAPDDQRPGAQDGGAGTLQMADLPQVGDVPGLPLPDGSNAEPADHGGGGDRPADQQGRARSEEQRTGGDEPDEDAGQRRTEDQDKRERQDEKARKNAGKGQGRGRDGRPEVTPASPASARGLGVADQ